MKKPIYVTGHKNPDTDSIVSAIAYSEYKKKQGIDTVPVRLGSTNSETEFLLEKFGFEDPMRMYTARSLLKEIGLDKMTLVSKDITMKKALEMILKTKNKVLMVADKQKRLEGVIALDDLTYMWTKQDAELDNIIKQIKIDDILDTLEGELVLKGNRGLSGKMHIFPSLRSNVEDDSIVLTRNEDDKIQYCIDLGASLVIVVTSSPISKTVIDFAKQADVTIISTSLSPLSVTRLIYQTPSIEHVMAIKEKVVYFDDDETVQDAIKKITKTRHRSYPVLDDKGKILGGLSRFHLFDYEKKKFILVDHNEYKQSIDNIEDGEVIEIIDHHRIGRFECESPINIITKPVGSTSTIIAELFFNNNIAINKNLAGLMLGAIISDTMNFNSPTTTITDKEIAKKLEKISKINANDLSKEMIKNSDSLISKKFIDIVYDDFKEFEIDGNKVGLSQASCKSKEEFDNIKKDLLAYLTDACKMNSYDLMIIMLTNPNGSGSYVLSVGKKKDILNDIFTIKDNYVKGLLSRKKQLLPKIIKAIGEK